MAKKTNDQTLKQAFTEMLKNFRIDKKFLQHKLIASWAQVMGAAVAHRTTRMFFKDKKLFVYLSSASLREELFNQRETIIKRLNEEAGAQIVEEIIFS